MTDHTEAMHRRDYAQDYRRASYYWSIERNGLVICEEYDVTGALHYLREIPPPPFIFHAKPYRGDLPSFHIPIEPGMEWIWMKRVDMAMSLGQSGQEITERTIFGRRHPSGREEVKMIYPDGIWYDFSAIPGEFGTMVTVQGFNGYAENLIIPKEFGACDAAIAHKRL